MRAAASSAATKGHRHPIRSDVTSWAGAGTIAVAPRCAPMVLWEWCTASQPLAGSPSEQRRRLQQRSAPRPPQERRMTGNATFRFDRASVVSVCGVDAPRVVTSAEFDDRLADTYRPGGPAPRAAGGAGRDHRAPVVAADVSFSDAAAMAGAKALAEAGVDPSDVGLLIDTSVSRAHLEPSAAAAVHAALGLPTSCLNFDLANACLGFLNGIQLAAVDDRRGPDRLRADRGRRGRAPHPRGHPRPAGPAGRLPRGRAGAVRHAHPRLRRGRDGAGPLGPAPGGPPARRRRHPGRDRAPPAVRRRPRVHADRHQGPPRRGHGDLHGAVAGRDGGVRLVRHGPLRRPPGLPGAHDRDVPDASASTRPGSR